MQPDGERFGEILGRVALRIPPRKMLYVTPAARSRPVAAGIPSRRRPEGRAPAGPPPQPESVVDGVAGFMAQDAHEVVCVAALDLAGSPLLQRAQARMQQIERHGNAGNPVRRKPFERNPGVRVQPESAALQLAAQPFHGTRDGGAADRQPEPGYAPREQLLVRQPCPVRMASLQRRVPPGLASTSVSASASISSARARDARISGGSAAAP